MVLPLGWDDVLPVIASTGAGHNARAGVDAHLGVDETLIGLGEPGLVGFR